MECSETMSDVNVTFTVVYQYCGLLCIRMLRVSVYIITHTHMLNASDKDLTRNYSIAISPQNHQHFVHLHGHKNTLVISS